MCLYRWRVPSNAKSSSGVPKFKAKFNTWPMCSNTHDKSKDTITQVLKKVHRVWNPDTNSCQNRFTSFKNITSFKFYYTGTLKPVPPFFYLCPLVNFFFSIFGCLVFLFILQQKIYARINRCFSNSQISIANDNFKSILSCRVSISLFWHFKKHFPLSLYTFEAVSLKSSNLLLSIKHDDSANSDFRCS